MKHYYLLSANDSGHHKSTMEYDKTYTRGTSLTIGRILDQTSSLYLNLGSNFNTNNKKHKGESDIYSSSISYFKAYKNHYFSHMFISISQIIEDKRTIK